MSIANSTASASTKMAFACGFDAAKHGGKHASKNNDYCAEDPHHAVWNSGFQAAMNGEIIPQECALEYRKNCRTFVPID